MPNPAPTPLTTAYRLTVMLVVLACFSLAAYRYRPAPGRLADAIDRIAAMVAGDQANTPAAPAAFTADGPPIAIESAEAAVPRFDAAVAPASALEPIPRADPPTLTQVAQSERLVAPVLAAGATHAEITPWGEGPDRVFRATAAMPAGDPSTGLQRRFDVIGETPEAAVAALVDAVRDEIYR